MASHCCSLDDDSPGDAPYAQRTPPRLGHSVVGPACLALGKLQDGGGAEPRCLDARTRNLGQRYFRAVAKTLDDPWRMAMAGARDPEIARRLMRVIACPTRPPPSALMRPSV